METIKTYKLLRRDEVGLHPLFIDKFVCLPMCEWINAKSPSDDALSYEPEGYSLIHLYHQRVMDRRSKKPTAEEVSRACVRFCRWVEIRQNKQRRKVYDLGISSNGQVIRFSHHPGWHSSATPSLPTVNMDGKVWAECLIPANDYTIRHMNINGMTAKSQPVEWYISNMIMIVKILEN